MCGIAGLFHPDIAKPVSVARVRVMTDVQSHRGPDGSGIWTAPGIGLGHRRLAIIDHDAGAQPMHSPDGAIVVTYNGEIYNHAELRRQLEGEGARFVSSSDTEVLIQGWLRWGPGVLDKMNGMFALALYDKREQMLFLARDRLGVKPLHYTYLPDGSIAFASELKGLLAHPGVRREPSVTAIEDYFALGYVPDDTCFISNIEKLSAGHCLMVQRGKPRPTPQRWWDVDFTCRASGNANVLSETLRERLRSAVRSRMVADVPIGAFLSGGVDSSTVVAFMAEASRTSVQSFAIGFDDPSLDERSHADQMARRFATVHRERVVSADDFGLIDSLVAAFDEPFADASALATLRLCQLARETVTVALSGDGADEIFAGYRRYRFHLAEERARSVLPRALRHAGGIIGRHYPAAPWAPRPLRAKATLESLALGGAEAYARAVGVTSPAIRAKLFSRALKRDLQGHRAEDRYVHAMEGAPADDPLSRAQYADLKIWLPGDILTKTDRTGMSVGLEIREPLLDHRLVEFGASLEPAMRLHRGEGKWLMKQAMRPYLPQQTLNRAKMGFVAPIGRWFRAALASEATGAAEVLSRTGWFDATFLNGLLPAHMSGRHDHSRLLWQIVMLERAMRRLFTV